MDISMMRGRRRILVVTLAAVAVAFLVVGLWWTKTIAFSKTAVVEISIVDTTPTTEPGYSGNLLSVQSLSGAIGVQVIADRIAKEQGLVADEIERDLSVAVDGTEIAITARGRTPTAAVELANDAADALAIVYTDIPSSDSSTKTTATVTRRAN